MTILHKLAHIWFGDMVTVIWWNGLWFNESFTEYASTLVTAGIIRWNQAWTTFRTLEKGRAYNRDQLSSIHPVTAKIHDLYDVEVNFDGTIYAKGASALIAFVGYVDRKNFPADIQRYLAAHAYANAELSNLLYELEEVPGRDLSTWIRL